MRPFEAECYADGWRDCIAGKLRSEYVAVDLNRWYTLEEVQGLPGYVREVAEELIEEARFVTRWTKADTDKHQRDYLRERMPHRWGTEAPTVCTRCGRKYSRHTGAERCKQRRKPNRWRVHWRRALTRDQVRRSDPAGEAPTTGRAILRAIERCEHAAKGLSDERAGRYLRFEDEQAWWKFSRPARRYRRLLALWWRLPAAETTRALAGTSGGHPDRWAGGFTRGRRKLVEQVRKTQARTVQHGPTTYTFYAHAQDDAGVYLFSDGAVAEHVHRHGARP